MKLLAVLLLASFCNSTAFGVTKVTIVNTAQKKEVLLNKDASSVLKKWKPSFKLYKIADFPKTVVELFNNEANELPMAVSGDFNGDGLPDTALLGHDLINQYVVVLIAESKTYQVVVAQTDAYTNPINLSIESDEGSEKGLPQYLSLMKAADLKFKNPTQKLDTFQIEKFRADTKAYYIKLNKIVEYKGLVE